MQLGARELWTVIHGLTLGTLFLLAFAGGFAFGSRGRRGEESEGERSDPRGQESREVRLGPVYLWTLILLGLGLLGTFPPFFEAFE